MNYHEGELEIQRRAGELESGRRNGVVIGDMIKGGARPFIERQRYVVVGSLDGDGQPWTHVLFGETGFARSEDGRRVTFDLARAFVDESDPLWSRLKHDARVGLLFVELGSRRRLRVNGTTRRDGDRLLVDVDEAYPNCPKYIQRREVIGRIAPAGAELPSARTGAVLPDDLQSLIRKADTFFVASAHAERGVDASHRGGLPGFVRVLGDRTLEIPDYPGNSMFNTLGNLATDPRAGLLFVDFTGGRTLQLSGRAEILWDQEEARKRTGGTGRIWRLHVTGWREAALPADVAWELLDASPFNPKS